MATIFLDGMDDYGPPPLSNAGSNIPSIATLLNQGGWSLLGSTGSTEPTIVAGLSSQGYALEFYSIGMGIQVELSKTLPANYATLIGGFRFTSNLATTVGVTFVDGSTAQCSVAILPTSGFISVTKGLYGTTLGTSSAAVTANTVHYLEFEISFNTGSGGTYTVWLDGVQVLTGSGITSQSAHNYANVFQFTGAASLTSGNFVIDDIYLFDTTTSVDNTPVLSNPEVISQFAIADYQKQFTNNGNVFGNIVAAQGAAYALGANELYLAAFIPNVNCTINDVVIGPVTTSTGINFKGVIYGNSAGAPGTLLSSGTQVTGSTAGASLALPLVTPQTLVAGTTYWLGFITDTAISYAEYNGVASGYKAANTYTSGAPSTAPTMTGNQASIMLYGACTGATTNWESIAINPPLGAVSSVASSAVNAEDLYTFPALPINVSVVYTVVVSGNAALLTTGSHTIDLITNSAGTASAGANTGQALTTNFAWFDSHFDTDPATGAAWTVTGVDNAQHGMEIVS